MKDYMKTMFAIVAVALMLIVAIIPVTYGENAAGDYNEAIDERDVTVTVNVKEADGSYLKGYSLVTIEGIVSEEGTTAKAMAVNGVAVFDITVSITQEVRISVDDESTLIQDPVSKKMFSNAAYGKNMPDETTLKVISDITVDIVSGSQSVSGDLYLKGSKIIADVTTEVQISGGSSITTTAIAGHFTFCGTPGETYSITATVCDVNFKGEVLVTNKAIDNVKVVAEDYLAYGLTNAPISTTDFEIIQPETGDCPIQDVSSPVFGELNDSLTCNWFAKISIDTSIRETVSSASIKAKFEHGIPDLTVKNAIKFKAGTTETAPELTDNSKIDLKPASVMIGAITVGGKYVLDTMTLNVNFQPDDSGASAPDPYICDEYGYFVVGNTVVVDDKEKQISGTLIVEDTNQYKFAPVKYKSGVVEIESTNEALVTVSTSSPAAHTFSIDVDGSLVVPVSLIPTGNGDYYVNNQASTFYVPIGSTLKIACTDESTDATFSGKIYGPTTIPTFAVKSTVTFRGQIMDGFTPVTFKYTKDVAELFKLTTEIKTENNLWLMIDGKKTDIDLNSLAENNDYNFKWDYTETTGWYYEFDYEYKGDETVGVMATYNNGSKEGRGFYFDSFNNTAIADPVTGTVGNIYVGCATMNIKATDYYEIEDPYGPWKENKPDGKIGNVPISGMKVSVSFYLVKLNGQVTDDKGEKATKITDWIKIGTVAEGITDADGVAKVDVGVFPYMLLADGEFSEANYTIKTMVEADDAFTSDVGLYTFTQQSPENFGYTEAQAKEIDGLYLWGEKAPVTLKMEYIDNRDDAPPSATSPGLLSRNVSLTSNEKTIVGFYTADGKGISGFAMDYVISAVNKDGTSTTIDVGAATIVGPLFFVNANAKVIRSILQPERQQECILYPIVDNTKFVSMSDDNVIRLSEIAETGGVAALFYKAKSTDPTLNFGVNMDLQSIVNSFKDKGKIDTEEAVGITAAIINAIPDIIASNFYKITVNGKPYDPMADDEIIKVGDMVNVGITQKSFKILLKDIEMGGSFEIPLSDGSVIKMKDLLIKLGEDYADYAFVINLDAVRYVDQNGDSHNVDLNGGTKFKFEGDTTIYGAIHIGYESAMPSTPEQSINPTVLAVGIFAVIIVAVAVAYVIFQQRRQ